MDIKETGSIVNLSCVARGVHCFVTDKNVIEKSKKWLYSANSLIGLIGLLFEFCFTFEQSGGAVCIYCDSCLHPALHPHTH